MRFLVDECTGPKVARWLQEQGHEVFSVYDEARGMDDNAILQKAFAEDWILVTNDKDFGEKVLYIDVVYSMIPNIKPESGEVPEGLLP